MAEGPPAKPRRPPLSFLNAHERDARANELYEKLPEQWCRVTDVLKSLFTEFNRKDVAKFMCAKDDSSLAEAEKKLDEMCELARNKGVTQHKNIEDFYDGNHRPDTIVNLLLHHDPLWDQFREYEFAREAEHVPFRTEWKIYDEENKLIGTPDFVMVDAKLTTDDELVFGIADWKVTRLVTHQGPSLDYGPFKTYCEDQGLSPYTDSNYYKFSLQVSIYAYILERNYHNIKWNNKVYPKCRVAWIEVVQFHEKRVHHKVHSLDMSSMPGGLVEKVLEARRKNNFLPIVKELWLFEMYKRKEPGSPLEEGEVRDEPEPVRPQCPEEGGSPDQKRPRLDAGECVERTWSP